MDCPKSSFGRRILRTTPSLLLWRALNRAVEARNPQQETAQALQKSVLALPGCQQMSVNTLWCLDAPPPLQIRITAQRNRNQITCQSVDKRVPYKPIPPKFGGWQVFPS